MAYEVDGFPPSRRAAARGLAVSDDKVARGGAALVVAFSCASSGLLVGLLLAGVHSIALAFVTGAVFAGIGTWVACDVMARFRGDVQD